MKDLDYKIKQVKLAQENIKLQEATLRLNLMMLRFRPSMNLPVRVYRDGGHWVCCLETSEEMLECPVAYGDSPHQSTINFDHLWLGVAQTINEPRREDDEDDDEDEFGGYDVDRELDEL